MAKTVMALIDGKMSMAVLQASCRVDLNPPTSAGADFGGREARVTFPAACGGTGFGACPEVQTNDSRRSVRYAKDLLAIQNFANLAIITIHLLFFFEVRSKL